MEEESDPDAVTEHGGPQTHPTPGWSGITPVMQKRPKPRRTRNSFQSGWPMRLLEVKEKKKGQRKKFCGKKLRKGKYLGKNLRSTRALSRWADKKQQILAARRSGPREDTVSET